ncbi:atrial natriuretic peptide receptor 1-like [Styela clava]
MYSRNSFTFAICLFAFTIIKARSYEINKTSGCLNLTNGRQLSDCHQSIIPVNNLKLKTFISEIVNASFIHDEEVNSTTKYEINIWVTVPFDDSYMFSKNHVMPAIYQALEDTGAVLCQNYTINGGEYPQHTCFTVSANDSRCNADFAMTQAVDIQDSRIIAEQCNSVDVLAGVETMNVFIGMTCDYAAGRVGALATNWDWPSIFPGTRTTIFDNKNQGCCETLTRTGHTATDIGKFVVRIYNEYNWTNSYVIYSYITNHGAPVDTTTRSDCTTLMGGVTAQFRGEKGWQNGKHYNISAQNDDNGVINNADKILDTIKNNARVSIWCIGRKAMRYIMNKAKEKRMTGGDYAFLYLDIYNTNISYEWSNEDDQNCELVLGNNDYCTKDVGNSSDGMRALQVISLRQSKTEKYKNFSDSMKKKMGSAISGDEQFVNPFLAQYYDAVKLLVHGVNKSIEKGNITDLSDGRSFTRLLWNITFESVDGLVKITETGDRVMDYTLMDMNNATQKFQEAVVYYGENQTYVEVVPIDWPGNEPPVNEPDCGYTPCEEHRVSTLVKALIGTFVVLLLCFIVTLFIAHRRIVKERKLRNMAWRVKPEEIDYNMRQRRQSGSTISQSSEATVTSHLNLHGRQVFTKTARWKNHFVAVKVFHRQKIQLDRNILVELQTMLSLEHEHLCKFIGASVDSPVTILTEYCSRGSLQDFLEGDTDWVDVDDVFRTSLIMDIAYGMQHIHRSTIHSHGNLKSSNCLVDSRFVVKITDFGLTSFRNRERRDSVVGYDHWKDMVWTAPELLRDDNASLKGTQKGDVYSFAIIVQEILYRKGAFYLGESEENSWTPRDICERVKLVQLNNPFRPTLADNDDVIIETKLRTLVTECWGEVPESRPGFSQILNAFKAKKKQNLVDSLLVRLEQYSNNLEEKVEERTDQYKAEKERADTLLYQMLPKSVAERLKRGQDVLPEKFDSVTIYFSDIVGFTAISHESTPFQVVEMLDHLYTMFDEIADKFDVYKVETIGDAYMVVSGLPDRNGKEHVRQIARMSLALINGVEHFEIPHMPDRKMKLRVGIHSGSVVAGVVGQKMPRYCLFGDTVNTAARMEQNGEALRIHVSPNTKSLLDEFGNFIIEKRDTMVPMKGLGTLQTWWLEAEDVEIDIVQELEKSYGNYVGELETISNKRISASSGYSSARTSIEVGRMRVSVTGVEDEVDARVDCVSKPYKESSLPSVVTFESECERPSKYPSPLTQCRKDRTTRNRQTITVSEHQNHRERRISVEGFPHELAEQLPRLRQLQHERHSSGVKPFKPATPGAVFDNVEDVRPQRKVKFEDSDGHENSFHSPRTKKKKFRKSKIVNVFQNSGYDDSLSSNDETTRL